SMAFAINGKFTSQRTTGVQRVAYELTRALHQSGAQAAELEVIVPRDAVPPGSTLAHQRRAAWLTGNLWEQITLPLAAGGRTLVSLCNAGPLFKRRQIVMVHDMAVYDVPHAFSRAFSLWYRLRFAMLRLTSARIVT